MASNGINKSIFWLFFENYRQSFLQFELLKEFFFSNETYNLIKLFCFSFRSLDY